MIDFKQIVISDELKVTVNKNSPEWIKRKDLIFNQNNIRQYIVFCYQVKIPTA